VDLERLGGALRTEELRCACQPPLLLLRGRHGLAAVQRRGATVPRCAATRRTPVVGCRSVASCSSSCSSSFASVGGGGGGSIRPRVGEWRGVGASVVAVGTTSVARCAAAPTVATAVARVVVGVAAIAITTSRRLCHGVC
jgi:hypothetical protein